MYPGSERRHKLHVVNHDAVCQKEHSTVLTFPRQHRNYGFRGIRAISNEDTRSDHVSLANTLSMHCVRYTHIELESETESGYQPLPNMEPIAGTSIKL